MQKLLHLIWDGLDLLVHTRELEFTEAWPEKSHCQQKERIKHIFSMPKRMWETLQTYGRMYSGQMGMKLSFLAIKENPISYTNPAPHITLRTRFPTLMYNSASVREPRNQTAWQMQVK